MQPLNYVATTQAFIMSITTTSGSTYTLTASQYETYIDLLISMSLEGMQLAFSLELDRRTRGL